MWQFKPSMNSIFINNFGGGEVRATGEAIFFYFGEERERSNYIEEQEPWPAGGVSSFLC